MSQQQPFIDVLLSIITQGHCELDTCTYPPNTYISFPTTHTCNKVLVFILGIGYERSVVRAMGVRMNPVPVGQEHPAPREVGVGLIAHESAEPLQSSITKRSSSSTPVHHVIDIPFSSDVNIGPKGSYQIRPPNKEVGCRERSSKPVSEPRTKGNHAIRVHLQCEIQNCDRQDFHVTYTECLD